MAKHHKKKKRTIPVTFEPTIPNGQVAPSGARSIRSTMPIWVCVIAGEDADAATNVDEMPIFDNRPVQMFRIIVDQDAVTSGFELSGTKELYLTYYG